MFVPLQTTAVGPEFFLIAYDLPAAGARQVGATECLTSTIS